MTIRPAAAVLIATALLAACASSSADKAGAAVGEAATQPLQDLNVVCRVLMEDGSLHYRLSARGHHHHLVCRTCGRVEDFATCDVSSLVRELARNTAYQIEGHWLEVYGRCASCRILEQVEARV